MGAILLIPHRAENQLGYTLGLSREHHTSRKARLLRIQQRLGARTGSI
jgi:hypothetical protein